MKIGAYAIERDYSHYVAYAAKTVFAVVGTATKGPVGVATVCTSTQDLVNRFGTLNTDCYALYAGQYFLSQASKLYFVRAASSSAAAAKATVRGTNTAGTDITEALVLKAVELGTYANGYSLTVSVGEPRKLPDDTTVETYNLVIKNNSSLTIEHIKGITLDELATHKYKSVALVSVDTSAISLAAGIYSFADGDDGISDISAADYIVAANALTPETVDMNLFAVPGVSDASVVTAMLSLAENRGDCLYLVDPPAGLTRDGVVDWHNGGGAYEHAAFNSSYGALYYDWVTIYDPINKVRVNVPPSVVVSATIAYSDRTTEVWYAPAGLNRGIVRGVLDSTTKLSKPDVEYIYSDGNNINAIYDDPQMGLVVWGQKTLHRSTTALDRVNVRRLMNYMKRIITAACNYLTFEPNDRITWNSFEMKIAPVLNNIKKKRGLYDFRIVKGNTIVTPEDIDNYRMPCMILIRPTKAAEEIPIYFTITSTGADFNDVLEANGVITN